MQKYIDAVKLYFKLPVAKIIGGLSLFCIVYIVWKKTHGKFSQAKKALKR